MIIQNHGRNISSSLPQEAYQSQRLMLYQLKSHPTRFHLSIPDMEIQMAVWVIWQLLPRQGRNPTTLIPRPIYRLLNQPFLFPPPPYYPQILHLLDLRCFGEGRKRWHH